MEKKPKIWLIISIIILLTLVIILFFYFALYRPGYSASNGDGLISPIANLSSAQEINSFNESYVAYVLYGMNANSLHAPPLSSDDPRIEFVVDGVGYGATVQNQVIKVAKGNLEKPDMIITTTKIEVINIIKDKAYLKETFTDGKSSIELKAGKATLFAKGYLNLYNELTGKSATGNVIKIYSS